MPKSGQLWDEHFLERSALLGELRALAEPLLRGATWPSLEACSAFVEAERRARAPELGPVRFAPPIARSRSRTMDSRSPMDGRSRPINSRSRPINSRSRPINSRSRPINIAQLYDGRIALHGEVPCLGTSYHDLLNVLVWAAFPRAKRALHARQYRALEAWLPPAAARLPNRRTREQDALALFDEGGSVLVLPPALGAALSMSASSQGVPLEPCTRVLLFGHAVMEHVCFEASMLSSAALVVGIEPPLPEGRALLDRVDHALAARLANPREFLRPEFDAVLTIQPPDRAWVRAESATG